MNFQHKWFTTMAEWEYTFQLVIQIVIPAVIVQRTQSRIDDIRQLLNKWRMVERSISVEIVLYIFIVLITSNDQMVGQANPTPGGKRVAYP